ncbi:MAG: OmpA family protein [Lutibacter sp.]|nr:OmpA family protein [Lutibacter sp.]
MKHLKIAVLAMLLIASYSNVNAQDENNPWMTTFGANYIDIKDGDSGSFLPFASLSRYIDKGFSLELAGAVNEFGRPWGTGADANFFGLDLNVKYDLNNAFGDTKWFDPYLFTGVGENWVGAENGLGFNLGLGFNAWFTEQVGVSLRSGYKKVNTPIDFEMFQHSVGLVWRFGKSDTDGDGIRDRDDKCPRVAGLAEFDGCPDTDADNDGVEDCCDACPDVFGLKEFNGCPDTDGDGVQDSEDDCPEVAGLVELNGCPDRDGDGVTDAEDECPDVFGPEPNSGCPYIDNDGDGVIDILDKCITVPGPASNDGCPEVFGAKETVDMAAKGINFDTGKSNLKPEVIVILDNVAEILNQNENLQFNFAVNGYTDSIGSSKLNITLSQNRANAVKDYLIEKGVDSNRLTAKGYGETSFIDSNDTRAGRLNNRRVEIKEIK